MALSQIETRLDKILELFRVDVNSALPINKQLSSIQLVDLVLKIEEEFKIEVSAFDYKPLYFETKRGIMDLIESCQRRQQ